MGRQGPTTDGDAGRRFTAGSRGCMTGCCSRRIARADARNMATTPHRHVSAPRKWATRLTARPPTGYTRFLARRAARQRRGGRAAEGAPLLREYTGKTCIESSNLSLSARRQRVTVQTVTLFAFNSMQLHSFLALRTSPRTPESPSRQPRCQTPTNGPWHRGLRCARRTEGHRTPDQGRLCRSQIARVKLGCPSGAAHLRQYGNAAGVGAVSRTPTRGHRAFGHSSGPSTHRGSRRQRG